MFENGWKITFEVKISFINESEFLFLLSFLFLSIGSNIKTHTVQLQIKYALSLANILLILDCCGWKPAVNTSYGWNCLKLYLFSLFN